MIKEAPSKEVISGFVENYPIHEIYRLFYRFFVSGSENFSGWLRGEQTEPGFLAGCIFTFVYELNTLEEKLSVNTIERIHQHVIDGVLDTNYTPDQIDNGQATFRNQGEYVGFGLIPGQNLSKAGLEELQKTTPNAYQYELRKESIGTTKRQYYKLACLSDSSRQDVSIILKEYHHEMELLFNSNQVPNEKEMITVICKMVSELERLHPYGDGNCRTLGLITLNRELIKLGLAPTIMDDPNQFDGFSQQELVAKILEGQQRYLEFLEYHRLVKTPFRSGHVSSNTSGQRVAKKELSSLNLVDVDSYTIEDKLEFLEDKTPFNGEPQSAVELIVQRIIVESALKKIHRISPSDLTKRLLFRLFDPNLKSSQNNSLFKYFYNNELAFRFAEFDLSLRINLMMAALRFNASCVVELIPQMLNLVSEPFTAHQIKLDSGQSVSLLGYCVEIQRMDLAVLMLNSKISLEQLEKAIIADMFDAFKHNNSQMIDRYVGLISQDNILSSDNPGPMSALKAAAECYEGLKKSKALQSNNNSLSTMLVYMHIKADPILESRNLMASVLNIATMDAKTDDFDLKLIEILKQTLGVVREKFLNAYNAKAQHLKIQQKKK